MSEAPAEPQPFEIGEPFGLSVSGDDDQSPEPEAGRRSPLRRIVLLALLVVAVAALGTIGYTAWQMTSQKDATLSAPDTIGPLRLDKSDDGQQTADYLRTALDASVTLHQTVGGVYTDGSGQHILFFGGTATIWSPESQLDNAFALISDKQGAVTGLHQVDAGKLGGTMKCGTTKSDDGSLSVCGWADHGSLALAMFPNQPESVAAPLLRQIRDATQKRQ